MNTNQKEKAQQKKGQQQPSSKSPMDDIKNKNKKTICIIAAVGMIIFLWTVVKLYNHWI
jgi:uncharacterized ion transporter superfamily protein YfcC